MAKFDKNIKNEFLNDEQFFYEDDIFEDGTVEGTVESEEIDSEVFESASEPEIEESETEFLEAESEKKADTSNDKLSADSEDTVGDGSLKTHWYVVHTYSGHENKVKVNIEKIVENRGMQDLIQCVVMPTEDVVEMKDGQRKVRTRKIFPGYVIVKMVMTSESWYVIRNTQGVTGFVGQGSEPIPLTDEEVRRMGIDKVTYEIDLAPGDTVKVIEGPFDNFMGYVDEVNHIKQTAKVRISMFGRETPVELEFSQIEKML